MNRFLSHSNYLASISSRKIYLSSLSKWMKPMQVNADGWDQAILNSEKLIRTKDRPIINPKELLGQDFQLLIDNISRLLSSGHPVLNTISNYYFSKKGKHIRPLIVLLLSQATASTSNTEVINIDQKLSILDSISFLSPHTAKGNPLILPQQKRLAEIIEMIHTASLLHDDVIDGASTRRSQPSANEAFGNKMAILAGDYLLARASVALARLRNVEVLEIMATVISNLVEGEFMQLKNAKSTRSIFNFWKSKDAVWNDMFDYYMEKTYLKTASLIAKSCEASAILGGCDKKIVELSYLYGKNLGLAFQVIDDVLDFVVSSEELGKPANADLKLGLATAPVIYASLEFPELVDPIKRNFSKPGDIILVRELVMKSNGIEKARNLAAHLCKEAAESISQLPPSAARTALIQLTEAVLLRRK